MTEDQLRKIVKTNIKRFRSYRKWTQTELAEKLEISINFLSDIENGKKWISLATMVKIASVLGIEPYELFKPSNMPPFSGTALFSRYNEEVVRAVSLSIEQIYNNYQSQIESNNLEYRLLDTGGSGD